MERRDGLRFSDRDGLLIGGIGLGPAQVEERLVCYFYVEDIETAVYIIGSKTVSSLAVF